MAEKRNGRGGGSRENECCDFCGSRRNDVGLLLTSADHRLNICDRCIAEAHKMLVAGGIIKDNARRTSNAGGDVYKAPQTMDELLKPVQIK